MGINQSLTQQGCSWVQRVRWWWVKDGARLSLKRVNECDRVRVVRGEDIKPARQKTCMTRTLVVFTEGMCVCVCGGSSCDQSDPLLDTWKSYPMLISAMNYETNKSVAVGLWEFCAAYWEVISGSSFDKPAVCIPLLLRNMLMKTELKSTGVH